MKMYTKYLNMKTKLHKTIANIYFNKGCLKHKFTSTYAKIKIKDTNKAATKITVGWHDGGKISKITN
jgi:hypothetical protein